VSTRAQNCTRACSLTNTRREAFCCILLVLRQLKCGTIFNQVLQTKLNIFNTIAHIMKNFSAIALIIFLYLNQLGFAQQAALTQTVRGQVIDALTEVPLPGATVLLLDSAPLQGTITDDRGQFRLDNVSIGRISLQISMIGYNTSIANKLLLSSGKELVLTFKLEEQVYQLDDIVVKPTIEKDKPLNEMALISARSFTIEETERYAGSLGDPSRMASNFAGVSSSSDQVNNIVIRGNSPYGLLWRLEGVDIPNPNHFGSIVSTGGPVSILNNNLLANSDFYTGAFPAEFGNALAGAFNLNMRNGNNEKREYTGQVGFNGFEIGAEGPFSKSSRASYLVNFRYSTLEVLKSLGMSFGTGEAIPQYKDLAFKINIPVKKGRISLFGLGGKSYIEMLDSKGDSASFGFAGTDLLFGAMMGVAGINYLHFFDDDSRLSTHLVVTGISNTTEMTDLSRNPDIPVILETDHEVTYKFSTKFSKRINTRNFINTGLVYDLIDVKYVGQEYSWNKNAYDYYMNARELIGLGRAFAEWQHKFNDQLSINSGLHISNLSLNNKFAVEPRLAAKWEFMPGQSFSLGAGMHSQTQPKAIYIMEKLVDTTHMIYERVNEHVDFSKSIHLVAGYDRLLGIGHRLKAEVYYQWLYNIPVSNLRPQYSALNQGGGFVFFPYHNLENAGNGENFGIEFTLEKFLHKGFYYLFTASVFEAKYAGYDGVWRNSAFSNNFVFNALGGYEWKTGQRTRLAIDLKGVLAGGNRYLPIDAAASLENDGTVYDWENAFAERYPDYFRLNACISFHLNGRKINQEWALDLQNLTNHENIFTENWNNYQKQITTSYQMGFMPMMTYKIHF